MPITHDELFATLHTAFPDAEITLKDLAGDNDHWQATIVSNVFAGKPRVAQHKMVQQAVTSHNIHALAITTKTPD